MYDMLPIATRILKHQYMQQSLLTPSSFEEIGQTHMEMKNLKNAIFPYILWRNEAVPS